MSHHKDHSGQGSGRDLHAVPVRSPGRASCSRSRGKLGRCIPQRLKHTPSVQASKQHARHEKKVQLLRSTLTL